MSTPMNKVSSLVSSGIGNYLTNKQTWQDIIVNVNSYGAKGDGKTDDTAAIQKAVDFINRLDGANVILYFPAGVYKISSTIRIRAHGVRVAGAGAGWRDQVIKESRIVAAASFAGSEVLRFQHPAAGYIRSIGLNNIHLDCGANAINGVTFVSVYDHVLIDKVQVDNIPATNNCFRFERDTNGLQEISQTITATNLFGYQAPESTGTAPVLYAENLQECIFIGCKMSGTQNSEAWHLRDCLGVTLLTPSAVAKKGLVIEQYERECKGIDVINPTFESCTTVLDTINTQTVLRASSTFANVSDGDTVRQGAVTGIAFIVGATAMYVRSVIGGDFTTGNLYRADGTTLIGSVSSVTPQMIYALKIDNPRVLASNQRTYLVNLNNCAEAHIDLKFPTSGAADSTYNVTISPASRQNKIFVSNNGYTITDNGTFNDVIVAGYPRKISSSVNGTSFALPPANKYLEIFVTADTNVITITPSGGNTIDGVNSSITVLAGTIRLVGTGAGAWMVAQNSGTYTQGTSYFGKLDNSVISVSANQTISNRFGGSTYLNGGASGAVTLTLPNAFVGNQYRVVRTNSQQLLVAPQPTDRILGTTGVNKTISLDTDLASVTIYCVSSGNWVVVESKGTITYS